MAKKRTRVDRSQRQTEQQEKRVDRRPEEIEKKPSTLAPKSDEPTVLIPIEQQIRQRAYEILRTEYPKLTPSLLDHAIWKHQRAQEETAQTACCRLPGNDQPSESKLGSNLGPDADQLGPKPCTTT